MDLTCNDCKIKQAEMGPEALAKGSSVREPGEALCGGCTSSRLMLVRRLKKVPDRLVDIQANRMVH